VWRQILEKILKGDRVGNELAPQGGEEFSFGPGTFSIGPIHPQVDWIPEGFYRGHALNEFWTQGFWRIHNGVDDQTDVVANNSGPFPLYVHITGGRFFTSSGAIWTRLNQ
jgi:hypothetical protein